MNHIKLPLMSLLLPLTLCFASFTAKKIELHIEETGASFSGGYSGLFCKEISSQKIECVTHTDRGPNPNPFKQKDTSGKEKTFRPFAKPDFQPKILRFEYDRASQETHPLQTLPLKNTKGEPLSGLPNDPDQDELPVNLKNATLTLDPWGFDLEGIVSASDDGFWMVEEYGPSLLNFSGDGVLRERFIPKMTTKRGGTGILDASLSKRKMNRGFEAIAKKDQFLLLFLQSPLGSGASTPVALFDIKSRKQIASYDYVMDSEHDRIGDAFYSAQDDRVYVVEQNGETGTKSSRKIYAIHFPSKVDHKNQILQKDWVVDLVPLIGREIDKIEGVAKIGETFLLVNDNDFGLSGDYDSKSGMLIKPQTPKKSFLFVLEKQPSS